MAVGDAAAAKGLKVVPATEDVAIGYDAINKRGDELAAEMDARAAAVAAEASARAAAITAAINSEASTRAAAVTSEANTRASADTTETNARIAADNAATTARALKLDASKIKIQQSDPGAVADGTVWISWV